MQVSTSAEFWNNRRVLITGITGFTGRHLADYLRNQGAQIFGFARNMHEPRPPVSWRGDLLNEADLRKHLPACDPDVIFHLAGNLKSKIPQAFYKVQVVGTVNLMEVIRGLGLSPKVMIISSSAVYGAGSNQPFREDELLAPHTHYGISKKTQELVAMYYFREYGIPVIICRPFNLAGPGMSSELALSAFARQIARAEREGGGTIRVGALDTVRDFLDVRDAVRAYTLVIERGAAGEVYNVASSTGKSMKECLEILLASSRVPINVEPDISRLQPADVPYQVGDSSKLRMATGWKANIPLKQSLVDLLDFWRSTDA